MIGGLLKSASSTALFAALGLIALGSVAPAAKAADLGGDSLADLEERVAELEATSAKKGNRKVSLTISGQVETAILGWDNGLRSDVYAGVDVPTVGGTLFNIAGSAKISPTVSAGFLIQTALETGARSHQVNEVDDDALTAGFGGDTVPVITQANWYLDSTTLGRVTVGRLATATNGVTGVDLAGTGVVANVNVGYWQRGFHLTSGDDIVGTGASGTFGSGTWNTILGGGSVNGSTLSRANAIMYTSPTYSGFSVSASWGENDIWDAAIRYAGEFNGFRLAAAIGYASNITGLNEADTFVPTTPNQTTPSLVKGSAALLHVATGLYLQGAFVDQDNDRDDSGRPHTTLYYGQAGIAKNWFGIGNTALYGEYSKVNDGATGVNVGGIGLLTDSSATVWGLGVVQSIDAAAMQVFLSYRKYSADISTASGGVDVNDFDAVMGGARIQF